MKKRILLVAGIMLLSASTCGAAGFDWGGDLRVRYTNTDTIPTNVPKLAFDQGFWRIRPRIWAQYKPTDDIGFKVRFINEFRYYDNDVFPPNSGKWDPLSEIVVDNLYADFNKLFNGLLDLRIGRQDLIYGTGKILLDGTPLDGSRTIYFNAVKAGLNLPGKNHVDLLAIFNKSDDDLAINGQGKGDYNSIPVVEQDETAYGFYGKNSMSKQFPFEYYYIYKKEDDRTGKKARPEVELHTLGMRLMPKFTESFKGNFEYAYQTGDHGDADISAMLFDGSLSYQFKKCPVKSTLSAGWYYLSGKDPQDKDHDEWHQVFARWPQISELYVYSFVGTDGSIGGWTNLSAPWLGYNNVPFAKASFKLRYYKMYANEEDGLGGGDDRGDLVTAVLKYKFTKHLSGHLWYEWLDPGDYHAPDADTAQFIRFNFQYTF